MADIKKEDVIKYIESMSVLDLAELVKELEEKFGVSAAAPMAVAAAAPAAAPAAGGETRVNAVVKRGGAAAGRKGANAVSPRPPTRGTAALGVFATIKPPENGSARQMNCPDRV